MSNFEKVGEGIFRIENTLSTEEAQYIFDYMYKNFNNPVQKGEAVPWELEKPNTLYYPVATDRRLIDIMNKHKIEMTDTLREIHGEIIYPHLTTLVLWKPGQQMPRHVDDGTNATGSIRENLRTRKYTSVCYVNDDFDGGETYIRSDGMTVPDYQSDTKYLYPNDEFSDFISTPKKGTTILFKGDESNAHGVKELLNGTRVILSIWFTIDPVYQEMLL
jgi:hypothetical protein